MFSVCVAAAIGNSSGTANQKTNLLFQFERPPAAAQVMSRSIAAFTQLQQQRGNHNEFFVNCAMIFDDASSRWVPLERSNQIVHNCQIYLFQPDVADVAGPIPDPTPAGSFLQTYVSPDRSRNLSVNNNNNGGGGNVERTPRAPMPSQPTNNNNNNNNYYQPRPDPPVQPYYYSNNNNNNNNNNNDYYSGGSRDINNNNNHTYPYNNNNGDVLSAEQREIFRREADRYTSTYVAGGSILKEERDKEEQKIVLPVDNHRARVRDETRRFPEEISPSKQRDGQNNNNNTTAKTNTPSNNAPATSAPRSQSQVDEL